MPFVHDVVVEGYDCLMAGFGLSLDWTGLVSPLDETSRFGCALVYIGSLGFPLAVGCSLDPCTSADGVGVGILVELSLELRISRHAEFPHETSELAAIVVNWSGEFACYLTHDLASLIDLAVLQRLVLLVWLLDATKVKILRSLEELLGFDANSLEWGVVFWFCKSETSGSIVNAAQDSNSFAALTSPKADTLLPLSSGTEISETTCSMAPAPVSTLTGGVLVPPGETPLVEDYSCFSQNLPSVEPLLHNEVQLDKLRDQLHHHQLLKKATAAQKHPKLQGSNFISQAAQNTITTKRQQPSSSTVPQRRGSFYTQSATDSLTSYVQTEACEQTSPYSSHGKSAHPHQQGCNCSQFIISLPKSAIHPAFYYRGSTIGIATSFKQAAHLSQLVQFWFSTKPMHQGTGRDQPHIH
ncbi:hypothetical protein Nepgr_006565 [Nepenthes gracilis]|uniref:Uncharacterized protein n=1 Tax=Nepenthes gracilis TaxID=150966 RepID=A0AAD3XHJ9_NEPGR|nr:hypothetical protein Nepgr_006565 [Nepenthes gracilis]